LQRSNRKLRTTTSIFLFFIVLVQTFSPFVYDAAYSFNKKYITANFCVNKDKPAMQCNGHCYLSRQKQKEESSDKQPTENKREKFEVSAYELPTETITSINTIAFKFQHNPVLNILLPGYTVAVFRPPLA
jgi:hypothetical protein